MRRRITGVGALAPLLVLGCDPQVGEEYTGEPMLSLQGNVVLTKEQASTELVPQVAFTADGPDNLFSQPFVLMDGEVSGDFPAKFRFDLMQPPPADAIRTDALRELGLEGGLAYGVLVMRPINDPGLQVVEWLEKDLIDDPCPEEGSVCTYVERACDEAGRCRELVIECTERPCTFEESILRDPLLDGEPGSYPARYDAELKCDAEDCYLIESGCDSEGVCTSDVFHCDPGQHRQYVERSGGVISACEILEKRGDASLVAVEELQTVAVDYSIAYVTVDVPDTPIGPLAQGYHLVFEPHQSPAEWLEAQKCQIAETMAAVSEYNEVNGTHYNSLELENDIEDIAIAAWDECDTSDEATLVERPFDEVLTLELGELELDDR